MSVANLVAFSSNWIVASISAVACFATSAVFELVIFAPFHSRKGKIVSPPETGAQKSTVSGAFQQAFQAFFYLFQLLA
jgi:hypothetical protein